MSEAIVPNNINTIMTVINRFSVEEKLRLINQLTRQIELDLRQNEKSHTKKLGGLWKDITLSSDDIDEIRNEMWNSFPRADH